jgi:hypothetical protein
MRLWNDLLAEQLLPVVPKLFDLACGDGDAARFLSIYETPCVRSEPLLADDTFDTGLLDDVLDDQAMAPASVDNSIVQDSRLRNTLSRNLEVGA